MIFRVGKWDRWASRFASAYARQGVALATASRSIDDKTPDHDLVLYDFEASPWCRLVREYATILDLTLTIKPCPRETLLFGEGSFGPNSRFRPEAMEWHQQAQQQQTRGARGKTTEQDETETKNNNHLTFPLLVDRTGKTNKNANTDNENENSGGVVVVSESYNIVAHLWEHYGGSVLPLPGHRHRPDQIANSPSRSFAARFLSLSGPSYLRPWPRCGLMRFPSQTTHTVESATIITLVLYQAEGCPESRLVREALCCLEIPYRSVPVAEGSSNSLPPLLVGAEADATERGGASSKETTIPVLEVFRENKNESNEKQGNAHVHEHFVGAEHCLDYLRQTYYDSNNGDDHSPEPSWLDPMPKDNLGRSDGANFSVVTAAFSAIRKGNEAFVPDRAME